ncbi:MAG: hypothetical protein FJ098_16645, partial [Deltaproteobacteria bacterium]|nr:hypothetical protein [Deltaproteobacteria bacterium]
MIRTLTVLLIGLLGPLPAGADTGYCPVVPPVGQGDGLCWNALPAAYRVAVQHLGAFALDREGTGSPLHDLAEHRLRWSPAIAWGPLRFKAELDVVEGLIAGDREDFAPEYRRMDRRADYEGRGFGGFLFREAYLEYLSPVGLVRLGQMTSRYGLGILSNEGADDDDRFGLRSRGDIVDRLLFATTPFLPLTGPDGWGRYLTFLLAGDLVFRDENAVLTDGDEAWMVNAGVFWRDPRWTNGFVFTWRTQRDRDGDSLQAYAFNVNGQNRFALTTRDGEPDLELRFEYELAYLLGETTRFQQFGSEDGLDLSGLGVVGRLALTSRATGLAGEFEAGYASGDSNPYDGTSHAFFFDPDYNVGMVFFEDMLPLITARSVEISSDPAHLATAPKGLDMVPTQGRVTNTFYFFPQLRWTLPWDMTAHVEKVQVLLGGLVIMTPARLAHSYYSFENGGVPVNHLGRPTDSPYAGTEFLAGLRARLWVWPEHAGVDLRLDQSLFLPGDALRDPAGETIDPV